MKISIVGLGYVGLPLSLQFARSGVTVLGLDIDPSKVEALNSGQSYIKHISSETISEAVEAGTFVASTDFSRVKEVERGDHLRADATEQKSRAGYFIYH